MIGFTGARAAALLEAAGMSTVEAERKGRLFDRARKAIRTLGAVEDRGAHAWFVPGRLEILGKHTDYAGGRSLLCAIERGHAVVAVARDDAQINVVDAKDGSVVRIPNAAGASLPSWSIYPLTVARRLARNFPEAKRGADIAFESDLPAAAGMSSSSALMIAVFLALAGVNDIASLDRYRAEIRTQEDLAGYLATVENGRDFGSLTGGSGVGTFGGSEDHTAILCCCAHQLAQYAFAPTRRERTAPLTADWVFAIAASGVAAEKTGAALTAYNDAADRTARILHVWRSATGRDAPSLAAAVRDDGSVERMRELLDAHDRNAGTKRRLRARLDQFVEESDRIVPEAVHLIATGHVDDLGPLADRSQELAEHVLGNQVPETIALARSARAIGAVASSAFGAGFGGSVWALIRGSEADEFLERWSSEYRRRFPSAAASAEFFTTRPGPAAFQVL
jgi:galactokinase